MSLLVCPACGRHTRAADPRCVHCDAAHGDGARPSPAGVLLGLWLGAALSSACQELYGISVADKFEHSGDTADTADTAQ